jgi:hypothetical protein
MVFFSLAALLSFFKARNSLNIPALKNARAWPVSKNSH